MRIRVYVDGLNFYYNVAKALNFKWLDLERCLHQALEKHFGIDIEIERVKLFTSTVFGESHGRQATYHNALRTHSPNLEIKLGKFRKSFKVGTLVGKCSQCKEERLVCQCLKCNLAESGIVKFCVFEEKQTDVNLAAAMIKDAYTASGEFDVACLVSNDSDLLAALTIKKELNQRTILLPPLVRERIANKNAAKALRNELLNPERDYIECFVGEDVRGCGLPEVVGRFGMPGEWGS